MIAGAINQVFARELPAVQTLGIAARLGFNEEEIGSHINVEINFRDPEGRTIATLRGGFDPEPITDPPPDESYGLMVGNYPLPLQSYGTHTISLEVGGEPLKTVKLAVRPPKEA